MVKLEEIAQGGAFDVVEAVRELARVVVELAAELKRIGGAEGVEKVQKGPKAQKAH